MNPSGIDRDLTLLNSLPIGPGLFRVVSKAGRRHLVLPSDREGALNALRLYRPQRLSGHLVAGLLNLGLKTGFAPLLPRFHSIHEHRDFDPPLPVIQEGTCGVLMGSAEHLTRRAVMSYRTDEHWEVAKVAWGDEGARSIRNEAAILSQLGARTSGIPPILGVHHGANLSVLRMPYIHGRPMKPSEEADALDLLEAWEGLGSVFKPATDFPEWPYIERALSATKTGRDALDTMAALTLREVVSHGDFARWNLTKTPTGGTIALDWEWGQTRGMSGLDLVHYHIQDFFLVKGADPRQTIRLVEACLGEDRAAKYLQRNGWHERPILPILACLAYKESARHQRRLDLLEAALDTFCIDRHLADARASVSAKARRPDTISFSIVTPSYHQVDMLKRCAASVADQKGDFGVEHLVHDGGSGAQFDEWARSQKSADCISEPDNGMYDAINRGFKRATGDIVAWLNCDEQYLPGTLQRVADYFRDHPEVDILVGDVILVDGDSHPLAYRRAVRPTVGHIRYSHLSTFSAATFVRRSAIDCGILLDTRWRTIADAVWIERLIDRGYRLEVIHAPLSTFSMLGTNLGQSKALHAERRAWEHETGSLSPIVRGFHVWSHRILKFLSGAYVPRRVKVDAFSDDIRSRVSTTKWLSGFWNTARNRVEEARITEDGSLRIRASRPPYTLSQVTLLACCSVLVAFFANFLISDQAVAAPMVLLIMLGVLAHRTKTPHLITTAILFTIVAALALYNIPKDVMLVRMATFVTASVIAVLLARSLRLSEEWMLTAIALIRRVSQPVILTDRSGAVILVNRNAEVRLGTKEDAMINRNLGLQLVEGSGEGTVPVRIVDWESRIPGSLHLIQEPDSAAGITRAIPLKVFMVGRGRNRLFGFELLEP